MSKNDITGDRLVSKVSNDKFAEGHDRIWGQKQRVICYWADGIWCDLLELPFYTHRSDDVAQLTVPFEWNDEQVENRVKDACSQG